MSEALHGSDEDESQPSQNECLICAGPAQRPCHLSCNCKIVCCAGCLINWLSHSGDPEDNPSLGSSPSDNPYRTSCPTCRRRDVKILTENNVDFSAELYRQGCMLVQEGMALIDPADDEKSLRGKTLLKEAVQRFTDAIIADEKNASAYNGMAYVSFLVADHTRVRRFLSMVLEWMPSRGYEVNEHSKAMATQIWAALPPEEQGVPVHEAQEAEDELSPQGSVVTK